MLSLVAPLAAPTNRQLAFRVNIMIMALELGEQAFVRQIQMVWMLPVVSRNFDHALNNAGGVDSNRQLPPAVETAGRKGYGADDQTTAVRDNDSFQQTRIGEHEHLYAERFLRPADGVQDRLDGIIGKYD